MGILAAIFGLITSFVLSLIIANAGAKRQIGFGWSLFLGIWLTPIVSLIAVLLSDKLQPDEYGRMEKKWGCLAPFVVSFLIIGTFVYIFYSYSNRSKQRVRTSIELQTPKFLKSETSEKSTKVEPIRQEKEVVVETMSPKVEFDKSEKSTFESLTKEGTNPANEIEVDLNDYLGTPNDGTDWNYTELSDDGCEVLARHKIYYSVNKGAWVKERSN